MMQTQKTQKGLNYEVMSGASSSTRSEPPPGIKAKVLTTPTAKYVPESRGSYLCLRIGGSMTLTLALFSVLVGVLVSRLECCGPEYALSAHGNDVKEELELEVANATLAEEEALANEVEPRKHYEYIADVYGELSGQREHADSALVAKEAAGLDAKRAYQKYSVYYTDLYRLNQDYNVDANEKKAVYNQCIVDLTGTSTVVPGEPEVCVTEKTEWELAEEAFESFIWVVIDVNGNIEQFPSSAALKDHVTKLEDEYIAAEVAITDAVEDKKQWDEVDDSEAAKAAALTAWENAQAVTTEKTAEKIEKEDALTEHKTAMTNGAICPTNERLNGQHFQCYDKTWGLWASVATSVTCLFVSFLLLGTAFLNARDAKHALAAEESKSEWNNVVAEDESLRQEERLQWMREQEEIARRMERRQTAVSTGPYSGARPYYKGAQWETQSTHSEGPPGVPRTVASPPNNFPPKEISRKKIVASV